MKEWRKRPREIANNFNPAFCGELIYYVVEDYYKIKKDGMPFLLLPFVLPIILHKATRDRIESSRTHMSVWLQRNPQVKINFGHRVNNLLDITLEAYVFLIEYNVIKIKEGKLFIINKPIKRKADTLHEETKACIGKAKVIGKWFARANDIGTVYVMWGVKP
ncbi:MAG TPA: hypothetical protein GX707_17340 [Epulopiscium sp.]|nr:hypothetical protein [Candidatus Epulonipiscium sp.]